MGYLRSEEHREWVQGLLGERRLEEAQLHGHVVEAPGAEAGPEVAQPRDEDLQSMRHRGSKGSGTQRKNSGWRLLASRSAY